MRTTHRCPEPVISSTGSSKSGPWLLSSALLNSGLPGKLLRNSVMLISLLPFSGFGHASVDVAGSADVAELNRYPQSYIVEYSQARVPEYRLALGRMKKVDGVIAPEKDDYVGGQLTRITYRIPAGHDSQEVMAYVKRQLQGLPHQLLFSCDGRDCGSSNDWANKQFEIARLYGIDREQHYMVVRLQTEDVVMVFYTVKRGNKRVYLHLDVIRSKVSSGQLTADELMQKLLRGERVVVSDRDWPPEELMALASTITALLKDRPLSDIWLVGHQAKRGPFVTLQNDSRVLAETLKRRLVGLGIDENRLKSFGVGPLAPSYDPAVAENRIELVVE